MVNVVSHTIFVPPKMICGTTCEFPMTGTTLHWVYSNFWTQKFLASQIFDGSLLSPGSDIHVQCCVLMQDFHALVCWGL